MDVTDVPHRETATNALLRPPKPLVLPRRQTIREMRARQVSPSFTSSQTSSLQKQLRDANDEIQRLKNELEKAQESAKSRPDNILSRLKGHVTCGICTTVMRDPFALECGHIFCRNCLQQWFSATLAVHVADHPGYDPRSCVPAEFLAWIRDRRLGKFAHCYVLSIIDRLIANTDHPAYTCPSCRAAVKNAPIPLFPFKALMHDLTGESNQMSGDGGQPPQWEDFLPFNTRDLVATQWLAPSEESM